VGDTFDSIHSYCVHFGFAGTVTMVTLKVLIMPDVALSLLLNLQMVTPHLSPPFDCTISSCNQEVFHQIL
jgi:hypothetical protein